MSQTLPNEWFLRSGRANAVVSWALTAVLVVVAGVALLSRRLDLFLLAAVAATVAIVPALVRGSWTYTIPWPLLAVAASPLVVTASGLFLGSFLFGIGVAALALLVVVALQMTTTVRMTPGFAIWFVFVSTLAIAGFWAVTSAVSANVFGTAFVETNDELMVVFTAAAVAGLVAGGVFRWYFRRLLNRHLERRGEEVRFA